MLVFLLIIWILGAIFNVGLWSMTMWDADEYTLGDVLIGVAFMLLSWCGWILLMFFPFYERLDSIVIYRRK